MTIFASGPDEARARVAPLFATIVQHTIWIGRTSREGSRLKLVNNTWIAFAAEAVAASMALAHRLELPTETVLDALASGPLCHPAAKLQRISKGEFSTQFALSLALKDVRLALRALDGAEFGALACLAEEWQQAVNRGLGDHDLTVVTQALE